MYDKNAAKIIGFIDLGTVGNQLLEFEQSCQSTTTYEHCMYLYLGGKKPGSEMEKEVKKPGLFQWVHVGKFDFI